MDEQFYNSTKQEQEREAPVSEEGKIDIDDLPWMQTVKKKLNSAARPQFGTSGHPTIFRVPDYIRDVDQKAYDPLVVCIGPYHHQHTPRGTRATIQDSKWKCVRHLLSRHRDQGRADELLNECLSKLKALDGEVRSSYSTKLNLGVHALAQMMLLDGCFIIDILLREWKREEESDEEDGEFIDGPSLGLLWIMNLVIYDLLKVENQIPFFILETLFDSLRTPADESMNLTELALKLFSEIHPDKADLAARHPNMEKVHHLLHLFHSTIIPSAPERRALENNEALPDSVPRATELQMAGVKFRRNNSARSFLDITFKDGMLQIPQLEVFDYTRSLFRNLLAFEQCYADTRSCVTYYAAFMDCTIDSAEDVKLLASKGILVNGLGTDEAVADLFNNLCDQIHYDANYNYLADVLIDVRRYHESKWHRYRAGLIRDYFSNPWAGIAVAAGVVLFLLTVEQSIFAALSYYYPP